MLKILAALVLLYACLCAAAYFVQDAMLFPAPPARDALPAGGVRLSLDAPDGTRLVGLRIAAAAPDPRAPAILGFGGNGWNAEDAASYLHDLYPRSEVIAFHYRGYWPSGGRPRSRDLEADSLLVYDLAARAFRGRKIVAIGFSIGSGVAAYAAARRPVAGLILVTPFDSLTEVAAAQLPFLPVRLLFRNPMEPAAALRASRLPVAIVAAGEDRLVRPARTEALRRAVPHLVYDRTIAGAGHNGIYAFPAFRAAMQEAMQRIAS